MRLTFLFEYFGVRGAKRNGVSASFERDGEVPDHWSFGAVGGAEDVIGAGRNGCGENGFAVPVQCGLANVVRVHEFADGRTASGWRAVVGVGLQRLARSGAFRDRRPNFA